MDQEANYAITGIFVIVLTVMLVFAIIWLSSGLSLTRYAIYEVDMPESVSGLNTNAVVEYNGVNVGKVKQIDINPDSPKLVKLLLAVRADTPVTLGTRATLNMRGLTGISYIALKDQGNNTRPLHILPHHQYPIIESNPSIFLQWDKTLNQLIENVGEVSDLMQKLLNQSNLKYLNNSLKNMSELSDTLVKNRIYLDQLTQRSAGILMGIQQQTLPMFNQLIDELNHSAKHFARLSNELQTNPSILLRGRARQPAGPGE